MRSLVDTEEDEDKASEITLSTASLLGIFFGLVLICGVFFGFGYSMGRGAGPSAQASTLEGSETVAAENQPAPVPVPAEPKTVAPPQAAPAPVEEPPAGTTSLKPVPPVISKPAATRDIPSSCGPMCPRWTLRPPLPDSPWCKSQLSPGAKMPMCWFPLCASVVMVSWCGMSLRTTCCTFRLAPFANRMQAAAIKQKLLSDGYNAIIKQ